MKSKAQLHDKKMRIILSHIYFRSEFNQGTLKQYVLTQIGNKETPLKYVDEI